MRPRVRGPISTVDHDAGHPVRQVARQRVPDAGTGPRGTPAEVVPVRQITGGRVDEPGDHLPRRPPSAPGRRRHRSRTAAPPKVGRHRQHHAAPGSPGEFLRHDSFLSSWRTSATGDSTDEDLRVQAQTSHPNRTSPVLPARWLLPPNRTIPRSATAVRRRNRGGSWAPDVRNRGSHAAPAGRQDGGDPSNRGRAVTRSQRGMPLPAQGTGSAFGPNPATLEPVPFDSRKT